MARVAAVLALAQVLTLAVAVGSNQLPLPGYMCGGHGRYAPGSAYETSLHRLAAAVPFQANASSCNCSTGSVAGERPEMVSASAFCYWRSDASSADCAACIALAFQEAQRLCPYHRQAMVVVDRGACSVSFHDVQRAEEDMGVGNTRQCPVDSNAPHVESICHCLKELMARQMLEKDLGKLENATEHPIQPLKLPPRIIDI
ncbi:hypothetical protein EJB05_12028, partial [Eragrostis curvula]